MSGLGFSCGKMSVSFNLIKPFFMPDKITPEPIYKVIFNNQGEVFEVYARYIYQSDLYGFIEIEELLFGERTQLLVDPGEEKLKAEFTGVKRSYIPVQSIIRIDEVDKQGVPKVSEGKGNVTQFPTKPGNQTPPVGQ